MKVWIELDFADLQSKWGDLPAPDDPTYKAKFVELSYIRLLERMGLISFMKTEHLPFGDSHFHGLLAPSARKVWFRLDLEEFRERLNMDPAPNKPEYKKFLCELGAFRFLDDAVHQIHTPGVLRGYQLLDAVIAAADGLPYLPQDREAAETRSSAASPSEKEPELVEA